MSVFRRTDRWCPQRSSRAHNRWLILSSCNRLRQQTHAGVIGIWSLGRTMECLGGLVSSSPSIHSDDVTSRTHAASSSGTSHVFVQRHRFPPPLLDGTPYWGCPVARDVADKRLPSNEYCTRYEQYCPPSHGPVNVRTEDGRKGTTIVAGDVWLAFVITTLAHQSTTRRSGGID